MSGSQVPFVGTWLVISLDAYFIQQIKTSAVISLAST
ncbi:hypothetical protein HNQ92_001500 [Rhabdobacter roseus]|uniref:Uncharacterized protein n=1 Tax=Rhabdobacter roseus TaxID=1655419 RepID=A0A840TIU7_9BACT|nr:hypothetical protein [Rhabdobacter roseus]